jgi:hypothetical protein
MNMEAALGQLRAKEAMMKGLYANMPSPYPGLISDEIQCGEEFRPEIELDEANLVLTVKGYVTPRLTFGACSWDLIEYRAFFKHYFCNGELRYAKGFWPLNANMSKAERYVEDLEC